MDILQLLLKSDGYIPHGHCYLWQPGLVWLHVISNAAIAIAYFSIPVLLIYFISQRKDIPFNSVFILFGAFIIACGTGHLMDIWTLWHPTYWLAGVVKAGTAIISLYTALELIPLIPKALALPSSAQLEMTNRELEQTLQTLKKAQSQLIQTEKMSSLGQLVAGVAHEINNPVNFIYGNLTHVNEYTRGLLNLLRLYEETYPDPPAKVQGAIDHIELPFVEEDLPRTLHSMKIGADRIRQIVLSLRNFSRIDEAERKPVNIHDGIDSTLLILQNRLKPRGNYPGIQITKDYGEIPLVECYAGQLNQVFMNLLSNAIDALEQQAEIAIGIEKLEPGQIAIETRLLDQRQIVIRITDNGPGVPDDARHNIFTPFFTTKPMGKGTGLGLSISYDIVVGKHGGTIECLPAPDQGTTFLIKIPLHLSAQKPQPSASAQSGFDLALPT